MEDIDRSLREQLSKHGLCMLSEHQIDGLYFNREFPNREVDNRELAGLFSS